jgi:hypothetical protein
MSSRPFNRVAAVVFAAVAVAHAYRAVQALPAQVGSMVVPMWVSWLAVVAAGILSAWGFRSRD